MIKGEEYLGAEVSDFGLLFEKAISEQAFTARIVEAEGWEPHLIRMCQTESSVPPEKGRLQACAPSPSPKVEGPFRAEINFWLMFTSHSK